MSKPSKAALKAIRLAFELKLRSDLDTFIFLKQRELDDLIAKSGVSLTSYLNDPDKWGSIDSKGFVQGVCIEELIEADPAEDWDGYNRWADFEKRAI